MSDTPRTACELRSWNAGMQKLKEAQPRLQGIRYSLDIGLFQELPDFSVLKAIGIVV